MLFIILSYIIINDSIEFNQILLKADKDNILFNDLPFKYIFSFFYGLPFKVDRNSDSKSCTFITTFSNW